MDKEIIVGSVDIFHPFFDSSNRDETILMSFHNVLINTNQTMLEVMIKEREKWVDEYPLLQSYIDCTDPFVKWVSTSCCTEKELLPNLTGKNPNINNDLLNLDHYNDIRSKCNYIADSYIPMMSIAIRNLINNPKIKKVYIIADRFDNNMLDFLKLFFKEKCNEKVIAIEGTIQEELLSNMDITTIIMESANELDKIISEIGDEKLKDKSFFIPRALLNVEPSNFIHLTSNEPEFINETKYPDYILDRGFQVAYYNLDIYME